ncbi:MAG: aldo/keto reductase [Alkalibacterium sp.]|nr:aldo/keto reductase [Alkalibacterium sp.]MDN6310186.1 aldo/keto reductase [Psychroflexus sp.]
MESNQLMTILKHSVCVHYQGTMEIVNQAEKFAEENNVNMTVIATVWVIQKGCFPIVGINSERFAEDIVEAFKVKFTDKIFKNLEELYLPRPFIG